MSPKILITGAAGYIGGSLVADFLASSDLPIENDQIIATVRSEEQAEALSKLGVHVVRLDLADETAVVETLLRHDISMVIHTASSINASLALPLITALGKRKKITGKPTYFIHTSGLSAFYEKTGWPSAETKDSDPVFEMERESMDSFIIRQTDVAVIEHSEVQGVTSFIVVPSTVYGKGTGGWNQLSVVIPIYIKGCIESRAISKFPENTKVAGVHISDLTALYGRIVEKVIRNQSPPSGREGYYFALGHDLLWWEVLDHLATALKARGFLMDTTISTWPNDEAAAKTMGVPVQFVQALWNSGENIVAERPRSIGWKPSWTKDRFLENIDDEIDDVVELSQAKSSLIASLFAAVGE